MSNGNCAVENCTNETWRREWCVRHYKKWLKYGDPTAGRDKVRPLCSVEGCGQPHNARGYCAVHYQRVVTHGTTERQTEPYPTNIEAAFKARVGLATDSGCMEWKSSPPPERYGYLKFKGKMYLAHRIAYELSHGPIPDGLVVRHKCDNPPCVNPEHLELGTVKNNSEDSVERGRSARGERVANSVLTHDQAQYAWDTRNGTEGTILADMFGVSPSTIYNVRRSRSWKYIDRT